MAAATSPRPIPVPAPFKRRIAWRLNPLDACFAREMLLPMSLGLIVLMLVLAGNFVYWAINSIVNQGLGVKPVIRLFLLSLPGFAVMGIPVGVILAVCLVLNRAVRDNEILAMRVGGASLPRIVLPFLFMAALASYADWLLVEKVAPITNDMAEKSLAKVMTQNVAPLIENDKYFRAGPYWFYVGYVENDVLHNVLIYERDATRYSNLAPATFPLVLQAQTAHENKKVAGQWILENVTLHSYGDDGTFTESKSARYSINVGQQISTYWAQQKQPFSMTGDEISKQINEASSASFDPTRIQTLRVDFYRRLALPCACFVMALCAAPMALKYARHGSFAGLVSAFLLAFLWQGFDGWFRALGIAGYLPPLVSAWATNGLFLVAGLILLARER